jgi:small subunit ribosomal protein S5
MAEAQNAQAPRRNSQNRGEGRRNDRRAPRGRRNEQVREEKQFEELVINIDRVSRVVKGGRRFRFKALVVVGDKKTKVGVGVAKGQDVTAAIAKATNVAKKNMVEIALEGDTIPHEVEKKVTGAHVLLKPAAPGTGIIAGGVVSPSRAISTIFFFATLVAFAIAAVTS